MTPLSSISHNHYDSCVLWPSMPFRMAACDRLWQRVYHTFPFRWMRCSSCRLYYLSFEMELNGFPEERLLAGDNFSIFYLPLFRATDFSIWIVIAPMGFINYVRCFGLLGMLCRTRFNSVDPNGHGDHLEPSPTSSKAIRSFPAILPATSICLLSPIIPIPSEHLSPMLQLPWKPIKNTINFHENRFLSSVNDAPLNEQNGFFCETHYLSNHRYHRAMLSSFIPNAFQERNWNEQRPNGIDRITFITASTWFFAGMFSVAFVWHKWILWKFYSIKISEKPKLDRPYFTRFFAWRHIGEWHSKWGCVFKQFSASKVSCGHKEFVLASFFALRKILEDSSATIEKEIWKISGRRVQTMQKHKIPTELLRVHCQPQLLPI